LRLSVIVLFVVLIIGGTVISLGFITTQDVIEISKIYNQYENLEKYKNELEKIILYNQKMLKDLENQIKNSDNVHLEQINEEIEIMNQVIIDNKAELEHIIQKLSQIKSPP
jgi:predicted PurR-regulated permease PerM